VDVLRVPHIIVCGHENCGGVRAATMHQSFGIVDNWLLEIKDIYEANRRELESKRDEAERLDLLARFNTVQQVMSLCATTIVQRAWHRAQSLSVHGVFFRLRDGVLEDLEMNINGPDALPESHRLTSSRRI
jgi:carbonic anhydrase